MDVNVFYSVYVGLKLQGLGSMSGGFLTITPE